MQCGIPFGLPFDKKTRWMRRLTHILALAAFSAGLVACNTGMQSTVTQPGAQIRLTPDSPSVHAGGKLQFSATVINASDSSVVWSASGGTITSTGLFTAPTVADARFVAVTARTASSSDEARVIVNIIAPGSQLRVATTVLPAGKIGNGYSATLAGMGGTQPYQWRISSGTLPSGLQLGSSSGLISGVTEQRGSFPFSVEVSDASAARATQNLILTMDAQVGSHCGPPTYPCSRSDVRVIPATAPPQLGSNPRYYGGHAGAGMVAVDPAYSNRMLRLTDGNMDSTLPGESYSAGASAEMNVTSYDETLFFLHDEDGRICLFDYQASSFSTHFHDCYYNLGSSYEFGYTEADGRAFYSYYQAKLYRFVIDTSNWTITADPNFNGGLGYFDPDNPNCLNGQIAANKWYVGDTSLSSDDNTLIAAVGPRQDDNPYFVVWNASKGCHWMNVQTWQTSRGWNTGLNNPVSITFASGRSPAQAGGIHNAHLDRSGAYGILTLHHVLTLDYKLFWTIGTNQVDDTCVQCTSHWACDFGVCFWDMGPNTGYGLVSQEIGHLAPVSDMSRLAAAGQWGNDEHLSHANAEPGQRLIYLAAWQPGTGGSSVNQVWEDEIVGVNWDGSQRTIRFNKNWASGYGGFAGCARCPISRQGNYALCSTDYQMYNLDKGFGNGLNQDTCDHTVDAGHRGTNGCRTDVVLFELR